MPNFTLWDFLIEHLIPLVALVGSISAIAVSLVSVHHAKKQLYANVIATSRLKWVDNMRARLAEYVALYYQEAALPPQQRYRMLQKAFEIDTFVNYHKDKPNEDYTALRAELHALLHAPAQEIVTDLDPLMHASQRVLANSYNRAKLEAGIAPRWERRIRDAIRKGDGFIHGKD